MIRQLCSPALAAHGLTPANNNGSGQIVAAGTKDQLAALAADLRPEPGSSNSASREPSTPCICNWPSPGSRRWHALSPLTTREPAAVQCRWSGRTRWPGGAQPAGGSGSLTGALGPVHGRDGRPGGHRPAGDAACGHLDRHRQTEPQGRRGLRPEHPGSARGGDGFRSEARRCRIRLPHCRQSHLAPDRLPGKGQFIRTEDIEADTILPSHSTVGMVKNVRDETPVNAPHGGIVVEWLVEDGDPVSPGQPLLRLHPTVESADATEVTR